MKRIKKGNALLLTTIILLAVSLLASGLVVYFYNANLMVRNSNVYFEKHIELSNQMTKTYQIILSKDAEINTTNKGNVQIRDKLGDDLELNDYTFDVNAYHYILAYKKANEYSISIETVYKKKKYHLENIVSYNTKYSEYTLENKEVYYVTTNI